MKSSTPSLAKLTPPKLPKIVERVRLYKELDRAKDRLITWITAPPGMGKTTLAASYIKARKLKCLWYQVDEGDADPATLFHYLGLASKKAAPRYRQPLSHLTPEYLPGLPIFTRRFFEQLFTRMKAPGVIVFDNYQLMPHDAPTQDLISLGFGEIPKGIRVLVLSRSETPPAFAKLQADQMLHTIKDDLLRLTPQETTQIVQLKNDKGQKRQSPKHLAGQLHKRTGGWVAGVVLSLEHGATETVKGESRGHEPPEVVFEYLAREVLASLPPEVQEVLLYTTFAPSVTEPMACALTKNPRAGKILGDLYRRRYFTERRMDTELVYQYHPLFRAFLQVTVSDTLSKSQVHHLKIETGEFLFKEGQVEEAAELFQSEQAFDQLVELIKRQAKLLVLQGRTQTLESWIRALPEDLVHQEPWMLYWLGNCQRVVDLPKSEELFIQAFEGFGKQNHHIGMLLSGILIIEGIFWSWLDWSRLDKWVDALHPIAKSIENFSDPEIEAHITLAMCSAMLWNNPKSSYLPFWLKKHEQLVERHPHLFLCSPLNHIFVSNYIARGEMNKVHASFQQIQNIFHEGVLIPPLARLSGYFGEAHYAWFMGDRARCDRVVSEGVAFGQKTGCFVMDFQIRFQALYGALLEYDLGAAEDILEQFKPHFQNAKGFIGAHFNAYYGIVMHFKGHSQQALEYLDTAHKILRQGGARFPLGLLFVLLANIYHSQGKTSEARALLPRISILKEQTESLLLDCIAKLGEADIAIDMEEHESARGLLQKGFEIARIQGYKYLSWWPKQVLAKLCTKALGWNIETEYVQSIIRQYQLVPTDSNSSLDHWPWAVRVKTLGQFSIEINGHPLASSRKVPRRSLLFLKALIALGGQDVPETSISDALWPEADGDMAHQAFATTLHRVRKLLGRDDLIQQQEKKLTLNPYWCWVDAWAFNNLVTQAIEAKHNGERDLQVQLLEQAIDLYKGQFLATDIDEPWSETLRDRLRTTYIRVVEDLADILIHQGQKDNAISHLEHGLALEPLAEPLHHRLKASLRE